MNNNIAIYHNLIIITKKTAILKNETSYKLFMSSPKFPLIFMGIWYLYANRIGKEVFNAAIQDRISYLNIQIPKFMMRNLIESIRSFIHFLTDVCAIIGGVFTGINVEWNFLKFRCRLYLSIVSCSISIHLVETDEHS